MESPTLPDNAYLMRHKNVGLIDATGGPGVVKAAYSSGKPALGVGPGNTPVYLEKSADLNAAIVDIIISKTFDNGTICASEQTVVIDDEIYEAALAKFADLGAHVCNEEETQRLQRTVIDPQTGFMQPMAVGQKAIDIARFAGLSVKPETKLLVAPIQGVGREHPLSVEKLFPVLAVYRAKSVSEALKVCVDVNHAGGLGHTAVIFSRNDEVIRKFGEVINAGRVIVNSPGAIGALGAVYNDLVPTFSFGCGTGGGNSTTDNVNIYHYLNIKRVARRTQNHMWFRVPNQIYFNMNAVENLRQFPSQSTIIVTSPLLEQIGHVDIVRRHICPEARIHVQVIPDAEPEVQVIQQGVEALHFDGDAAKILFVPLVKGQLAEERFSGEHESGSCREIFLDGDCQTMLHFRLRYAAVDRQRREPRRARRFTKGLFNSSSYLRLRRTLVRATALAALLSVANFCGAQSDKSTSQTADPQIAAALRQISAQRIQANIEKLVSFRTRLTISARGSGVHRRGPRNWRGAGVDQVGGRISPTR